MKLFLVCVLVSVCTAAVFDDDEVSPEEGSFFEGDMMLNPQQKMAIKEQLSKSKKPHAFAAIKTGLWLSGNRAETIKYYIDPVVAGATKYIYEAVAEYHQKTCIRFTRVTRRPSGPHIHFTTGTGCSSPVGRQSRGNSIHLARGCWHRGTIEHEMGHSLGFFHEQSRPDRDNYVEILWGNIKRGHEHNFNKYGLNRIDSRGFAYDLDSMMHYGGTAFSTDRRTKLTIRAKNPAMQKRIGQRQGMSAGDVAQLKAMYHC